MTQNILFLLLALTILACGRVPKNDQITTKAEEDSIFTLYAKGKNHEAKQACKKLLAQSNTDVFANQMLGMIELGLENYEDARKYLEIAIKLNPQNIQSHLSLGRTCLKLKDLSTAEKHLRFVAKADTLDYAPFLYLGQLQAGSHRMEEAEQSYNKAVVLVNKYTKNNILKAHVYRHQAMLFKDLKRYHEAIATYNTLIELVPEDGYYYYLRGLIYFALNQPSKACHDYRMAAIYGSKNAKSLLGTCFDDRIPETRIM